MKGLQIDKAICWHSAMAILMAAWLFSTGVTAVAKSALLHQSTEASTATGDAEENTERIRVAEGEYKVLTENGIGPFLPAVYGFTESWSLWRLPDGNFKISGTRSYRSPSNVPHSNDFFVHLSSDFRVSRLNEYRRLQWRADSGPLSCEFLPDRLVCTSNAKITRQEVSLDLPLQHPFGFLWPISPFSLGGITRSARRDLKTPTTVDLVRLEEASKADPVLATVLTGQLKYLGEEEISLANHEWHADKFELKVPAHAPFILWTSSQGLVLAFAPKNKERTLPQDGLALVRFQQWEAF